MDVEKELYDMNMKSREYLESISAHELMKKACLFTDELRKLTDDQPMPVIIIIGCLMDEIHRLNTKYEDVILAGKLLKSFTGMKKYVDESFMKKERTVSRNGNSL